MKRSLATVQLRALLVLATAGTALDVAEARAPASEGKPMVSPKMQAQFKACLAGLRDDASKEGISAATFAANTADLVPDPSVLELLNRQPEFSTPVWDYMAGLVDEERVADGRAMLARYADVLARVQQRYGVDPATVVAVWGVESDYGRNFGTRPLLASLATLSCFDRRQKFFRGELFSTLQIIQSGDIGADRLQGSWAGAFGHTQFMPSTFQRIAVDFDGDGRRDLIGSVPDALASTAHYLDRSGWRSGQPWGYEVRVPDGFNAGLAGRTDRRALSDWLRRGIKRADGQPIDLPGDTRAALLLPAGVEGPAFLVFKNFDAIYSYNASESYALAIAHLSDRLRGGGAFVTPWPTDDPGLSRKERKELQTLLLARGHDIGEVDGLIGSRTREAIKQEQQRLGHAVDGRAGQRLLQALRDTTRVPADSATIGGDGSRIVLTRLSATDIASAALPGELACSFSIAGQGTLLLAKGNVASSEPSRGVVKMGDYLEMVFAPGGFDGMLRGARFSGKGKTVTIEVTGPAIGGGESPPNPAMLTYERADGARRQFSGQWQCGP